MIIYFFTRSHKNNIIWYHHVWPCTLSNFSIQKHHDSVNLWNCNTCEMKNLSPHNRRPRKHLRLSNHEKYNVKEWALAKQDPTFVKTLSPSNVAIYSGKYLPNGNKQILFGHEGTRILHKKTPCVPGLAYSLFTRQASHAWENREY